MLLDSDKHPDKQEAHTKYGNTCRGRPPEGGNGKNTNMNSKSENKSFPKERVFRKTTTQEIIERPFTTQPKTRRHKKQSISGNRCRVFMEYLWRKGFKTECKYKGLEIQFVQCFETNEARVIHKYIGRPQLTIEYPREQIVRSKTTDGGSSLARFNYEHKRQAKPKTGLMEILGYITLDKKTGQVSIHHEFLSYYTEQTRFNEVDPPRNPPIQSDERLDSPKQDLCVCSIEHETCERGDKTDDGEEREERERYRLHTHKSGNSRVKLNGDGIQNRIQSEVSEFLKVLDKEVKP